MKMKKWVWLVLFAMLLTGCSQTKEIETGNETTADSSAETETVAETETEISDDLPDVTFDGREFRPIRGTAVRVYTSTVCTSRI